MLLLEPIYQNNIGATYYIKGDLNTGKIQLTIEDCALIFENKELSSFLKIINSAKNGCMCPSCESKAPKHITCKTHHVKFIFESNDENIIELEELIETTIFELQMISILKNNKIG